MCPDPHHTKRVWYITSDFLVVTNKHVCMACEQANMLISIVFHTKEYFIIRNLFVCTQRKLLISFRVSFVLQILVMQILSLNSQRYLRLT